MLFEQNIGDILYGLVAVVAEGIFGEGLGTLGAVGVPTRQQNRPRVRRPPTRPTSLEIRPRAISWIYSTNIHPQNNHHAKNHRARNHFHNCVKNVLQVFSVETLVYREGGYNTLLLGSKVL